MNRKRVLSCSCMMTVPRQLKDLPEFPTNFYVHYPYGSGIAMRTVTERRLDELTGSIREKPQGWRHVHQQEIVQKCRVEAATQNVSGELFDFAVQARIELSSPSYGCSFLVGS